MRTRKTKGTKLPRLLGKSPRAVALALLSMMIFVALPSSAWAVNEFSVGQRVQSSANLDGLRGNQGIRTNPGTVSGVSFVHPTQMDIGSQGGDFLAIGTYNGQGTTGGSTNCPSDFDLNWNVYVDGVLGGVYFCDRVQQDSYTKDVSPGFRIEWAPCIGHDENRWLLYFGGTLWRCPNTSTSSAIRAIAGIEVVSSNGVDRNVDAKYSSLNVNLTGSTSWQSFSHNASQVDPSYSFGAVSSTAFNTFLAPLD